MRKQCHKTLSACRCNGKSKSNGSSDCDDNVKSGMFQIDNWYRPGSLTELTELLSTFDSQTKYRLVAGNTGTGTVRHFSPVRLF